jgi:hypothetical protein
MRVQSFAAIEEAFIVRAHGTVWCSAATIDGHARPRSRVLHPIWEGATGWVTTRRRSPKGKDLAATPYVSLAYVADPVHPTYADCLAQWEDDLAVKQRVWDLCRAAPPPLGYDPGTMFRDASDPDYGLLRLTPYRIALEDVSGTGERRLIWRAPA